MTDIGTMSSDNEDYQDRPIFWTRDQLEAHNAMRFAEYVQKLMAKKETEEEE